MSIGTVSQSSVLVEHRPRFGGLSRRWMREILPPALGWTLVVEGALYLAAAGFWQALYPQERVVVLIMVLVLGFYISVRALLRASHPPPGLAASLLYVAHLIHVFLVILVAAFGLLAWGQGDGAWHWLIRNGTLAQQASPANAGEPHRGVADTLGPAWLA